MKNFKTSDDLIGKLPKIVKTGDYATDPTGEA